MLFFILAGGYGKRAEPLSFIKPKPLFPLCGTPVIDILLNQLKKKNLKKGFINLHYKAGMIREHISSDLQIQYLYEEELSGSKILTKAAPYTTDFLLVVNGDMFLDIPVEEMQKEISGCDCDGILLLRQIVEPGYPTIILEDGYYVRRKKNGEKKGYMYTGTALFKKKVLEKIDEINFFDTLDKSGFRIKTLVYQGTWLDIGTPRTYFEADSRYRKYINAPGSNSLSRNVRISAAAPVKNSIIWEDTTICEKSEISHCILTGNLTLKNVSYRNKIITKDNIYDL